MRTTVKVRCYFCIYVKQPEFTHLLHSCVGGFLQNVHLFYEDKSIKNGEFCKIDCTTPFEIYKPPALSCIRDEDRYQWCLKFKCDFHIVVFDMSKIHELELDLVKEFPNLMDFLNDRFFDARGQVFEIIDINLGILEIIG